MPALEAIKPGGKAHPIDRMLHDGEEVDARRHDARRASDARPHARLHDLDDDERRRAARIYNVVFACSYRAQRP